MATFVLTAHDAVASYPTLRGSGHPLNVTLQVWEAVTEHRASPLPGWTGPGPVVAGLVPPPLDPAGDWSCAVGAADGTLFGALDATAVSLGWELNGLGTDSVYMAAHAPTAALLFDAQGNFLDGREVEIYHDGDYVKSTVPMPRQAPGPTTLDLSGPGFAYPLRRRYVGRLNPAPNLAVNPTFATDLAGWTTFGGAVATWVPSPTSDAGVGAAQLSLSSVGFGGIQQDIPVGGYPFDTFVWVTAWVNVAAAVADYMVPPDQAGIQIELFVGGVSVWTQIPEPENGPDWRIKDRYQRVRMKVYIPASGAMTMRLQLRAPENVAFWDQVYVHQEERLYAAGDPATVATLLVSHAQDTGIGKTDLFIGSRTEWGGSVNLTRAYKYSSRANIWTALGEMATLEGGIDFLPEQPARTTREIVHYARDGFEPSAGRAEIRWGWNIASYGWAWAGEQHADRLIVLARGDGFEPLEGLYLDDDSELGWEYVRAAPIEGYVDPDVAAAGLGQAMARPLILQVVVHRAAGFDPADLCKAADGRLLPARLVDVELIDGQVYVLEPMKITRTQLDTEHHTATLDLVMVTAFTP